MITSAFKSDTQPALAETVYQPSFEFKQTALPRNAQRLEVSRMGIVRQINDELAIAGQITLEDLQTLADEGFRSVVNLRSPSEEGFLTIEQAKTELLGLSYTNIPTKLHETDLDAILSVIRQIAEMPKPLLLHCDNGIRSATIALIHVAIKQGMDLDQVFQRVVQLGLL